MKRSDVLSALLPATFIALTCICTVTCTPDGRLKPAVASAVDILDDAACKFVPSGGAEVCEAAASFLDSILKALSTTVHSEPRTFSVTYQGKIIARKLTAKEAERVRRALDGLDGGVL